MILHWRLEGADHQWTVPHELETCYYLWLEHHLEPDQYRDLRPQMACRIFEAWIRFKEKEAVTEKERNRILESAHRFNIGELT